MTRGDQRSRTWQNRTGPQCPAWEPLSLLKWPGASSCSKSRTIVNLAVCHSDILLSFCLCERSRLLQKLEARYLRLGCRRELLSSSLSIQTPRETLSFLDTRGILGRGLMVFSECVLTLQGATGHSLAPCSLLASLSPANYRASSRKIKQQNSRDGCVLTRQCCFCLKEKEQRKQKQKPDRQMGVEGWNSGFVLHMAYKLYMQPRTAMSKVQHKIRELLKTSQVVLLGFNMWPGTICLCLVWLREPKAWMALIYRRSSHTWPPRCWTWPPWPCFPFCLRLLICPGPSLVRTGMGAKAAQLLLLFSFLYRFLWNERKRGVWEPKEGHLQSGSLLRELGGGTFFFSRLFLNDVFYSFHTLFLNKTP